MREKKKKVMQGWKKNKNNGLVTKIVEIKKKKKRQTFFSFSIITALRLHVIERGQSPHQLPTASCPPPFAPTNSPSQATVFVIDVGPQMGVPHHDRTKSDLEAGLDFVYDVISNKIMSERKTDLVGVVAFNANETNNRFGQGYANIEVLNGISMYVDFLSI